MKINDAITITGPNADDTFTLMWTGAYGGCGYYSITRAEANRCVEALRVGTTAWWDEQIAEVTAYEERSRLEDFTTGSDHGDENDRPPLYTTNPVDDPDHRGF